MKREITLAVLRDIFYLEHEKEKKITIRNYMIVTTIAVFAIVAIIYLFFGKILNGADYFIKDNSTPILLKLIVPFIFLGILFAPTKVLYLAIKKRPKIIEEVLVYFEEGKYADHFQEEKIYKTTIPAIKIEFKLNPFYYLSFMMNGKMFKLPVPFELLTDIKSALSGANMGKVYDVLNDLYSDNKNTNTQEVSVPLKSMKEFKQFVQSELSGTMESAEKGRKTYMKYLYAAVAFAIIVPAIFMFFNYRSAKQDSELTENPTTENITQYQEKQSDKTKYILAAFGILVFASYAFSAFQKKKYANIATTNNGSDFTTFKSNFLKKTLHFINPGFEYVKNSHIALQDILYSNVFINKNYALTGNDLIVGRHQGIPFQYSDINITYKRNLTDAKEAPDNVFFGQVFIAKFNKTISQPLYVFSKSSLKGFFTNNDIHTYLTSAGPKVMLEDPEFSKNFDVYCDDQIMARYILTPNLMEKLKGLSVQEKKSQLFVAFHNSTITVLNNTMKDKFETNMRTSITAQLLESFYDDLQKQLSIIEELKLNINIWKN